jgi:hypothetical protein
LFQLEQSGRVRSKHFVPLPPYFVPDHHRFVPTFCALFHYYSPLVQKVIGYMEQWNKVEQAGQYGRVSGEFFALPRGVPSPNPRGGRKVATGAAKRAFGAAEKEKAERVGLPMV